MMLLKTAVSEADQCATEETEAGCQRIFTEQMSGAVTDRPALHDAVEFARSGDTLIVWKLDRLARSMKQLIETIENLRVRGIGFRSLTEALDTTTAQGRLVFHMFGALAEFERSLIRERTQAGLTAARRLGRTGPAVLCRGQYCNCRRVPCSAVPRDMDHLAARISGRRRGSPPACYSRRRASRVFRTGNRSCRTLPAPRPSRVRGGIDTAFKSAPPRQTAAVIF